MTAKEKQETAENLAEAVKWDGLELSEIYLDALTDCNFHELRKKIEPILKDYFELKN